MTRRTREFNRFAWVIRSSPLLVAIILAGLWIAGAPARVPDIRLSGPIVARPGTTIGIRTWQLEGDDARGAIVASPPVRVELRNASGLTIARADLSASKVHGREGRLRVPLGLDEATSLVAIAEVDGSEATVEQTLYVREGIDSRLERGRTVNAFQTYELGPIRVAGSRERSPVLDPRVEQGACVPDLSCTVSVWVGDSDNRVRLRPLVGVRVETDAVVPSNGFVRIPLQVSGNEARVDVEALRPDGTVLAARELRLPLVPGGIAARASIDGGRIRLDWDQLGGAEPVLVDVFAGSRWVEAHSLSPDDPYLPAPGPGVWRLQVRADLFSDNTAGVSYVVIPAPDGPGRARAAADAVLADADRKGLDPLALSVLEQLPPEDAVDDTIRALFAVPSFDVISVGGGMSSRVGVDRALEMEQDLRRWQAAAVILLIGLIVSMILLRVELVSMARARSLLDDLGDESTSPSRAVSPGRGLWAFVLLVFVLMAVLALSKRWF